MYTVNPYQYFVSQYQEQVFQKEVPQQPMNQQLQPMLQHQPMHQQYHTLSQQMFSPQSLQSDVNLDQYNTQYVLCNIFDLPNQTVSHSLTNDEANLDLPTALEIDAFRSVQSSEPFTMDTFEHVPWYDHFFKY